VPLVIDSESRFAEKTARLGRAEQDCAGVYGCAAGDKWCNRIVRVVFDQGQGASRLENTSHFPQ